MIEVVENRFPLAQVFTISRGSRTEACVLTVSVTREGVTGYGECVPYARYGETLESVTAQVRSLDPLISRHDLQESLSAGAARNAVDCALWDWQAKKAGVPVWQLANCPAPQPLLTAFTLSLGEPDTMRDEAVKQAKRPLLKIKLGGEGDIARLEAVRLGAPDARIIVDANEGWDGETYKELAPVMVRLGVELVEQPMPVDQDGALLELERVLPVCADESCHDRASLDRLQGKYDMVNIKLDKTGGLTEALALKTAAMAAGFGVMVGCMVGSSLAMAPAILVGQGADMVDLDGPLLLAKDRDYRLRYDGSLVYPPKPELWG